MFEPGRTYTLPDQGSVYVAELLPDGQLFLRDLNRGQFWRCGGGSKQGWAEGYLGSPSVGSDPSTGSGQGGVMEPYQYEVADGAVPVLAPMLERGGRLEREFARCGVERRVVSVEEWLGLDEWAAGAITH